MLGVLKNSGLLNVGFAEVFGGPGGFRKVREAGSKNFLLVSSKSDLMVPSYDQKNRKLTIMKATTISI